MAHCTHMLEDRQEYPCLPHRPGAWLRLVGLRLVGLWRGVRRAARGGSRNMLPLLPCLARWASECVHDDDVRMDAEARAPGVAVCCGWREGANLQAR